MELLFIFIPLLAVYCIFEAKEEFKLMTILKIITSAFVAFTACLFTLKRTSLGTVEIYQYIISSALLIAVPADYFLQFIKSDQQKYSIGILLFSATQLLLITSFIIKYGIHPISFLILLILLIIAKILQTVQKWDLGDQEKVLTVYTVLVTMMCAFAISSYFDSRDLTSLITCTGGILFFASDVILGIWCYHLPNSTCLNVLNKITYFSGTFCIAFSIGIALLI